MITHGAATVPHEWIVVSDDGSRPPGRFEFSRRCDPRTNRPMLRAIPVAGQRASLLRDRVWMPRSLRLGQNFPG
jgi:hypothetical protein